MKKFLCCFITLFFIVSCNVKEPVGTCTLSISCETILENMDSFNKDKLEILPNEGVIYKEQEVEFYEGESVFDLLKRETKNNQIHFEFSITPIYNSVYIEGINNIYEFDCGELSGWMYKVNGIAPNISCSEYKLSDDDIIQILYTCNLGKDIDINFNGGQ